MEEEGTATTADAELGAAPRTRWCARAFAAGAAPRATWTRALSTAAATAAATWASVSAAATSRERPAISTSPPLLLRRRPRRRRRRTFAGWRTIAVGVASARTAPTAHAPALAEAASLASAASRLWALALAAAQVMASAITIQVSACAAWDGGEDCGRSACADEHDPFLQKGCHGRGHCVCDRATRSCGCECHVGFAPPCAPTPRARATATAYREGGVRGKCVCAEGWRGKDWASTSAPRAAPARMAASTTSA